MPNTTDEPVDASAEIPAPNVHVIIAAVWDYENKALQGLSGPAKDVVMMKRFFDSTESNVGVHASKEVEVLENPTAEKLRAVLVNYQDTRSATGDILIFYFSGHGAVLGDQFVFCFKDTMIRPDGTYVPLTVLRFDDIVQTLAGAQVHPVFILDACFSGTAGANDLLSLVSAMHEKVRLASGRSYALLCACHAQGPAEDTPKGGAFTKALFDAGQAGLADKAHRRQKFLEVKDLSQSVQARLTREGFPLPKSWFGDDLPSFPLVRNVAFQPRIETLMPHHGQTLDLLWNNGNPRTVTITDIRENCGQSAYGNHRKLSWGWNLVENAGDSKHRRLTELGKRFMAGDLKVSEVIEWDPVKSVWRAAKDARQIARSEIGATKALMARVRKHSSKRTRKQ
ncbi:MAG: caspase family protein [Dehalococcoidia bacterium]|nr:caspase family protein [Dehalococcoidia bacterium]